MLSKTPRSLLAAAVVVPLTLTLPRVEAVDSTRTTISLGISDAMAAPPEATAQDPEYIQEGTQRILRVRGENLDALHSIASHEFIRRIEEEIKKPGAELTIANFETDVRFEGGEFVFEYRVNLNPAPSQNEVHTLIGMRETVHYGRDAKTKVLLENSTKVPGWRDQMSAAYPGMKLLYEVANSEKNSTIGPIFHEAVLVKGGHPKQHR